MLISMIVKLSEWRATWNYDFVTTLILLKQVFVENGLQSISNRVKFVKSWNLLYKSRSGLMLSEEWVESASKKGKHINTNFHIIILALFSNYFSLLWRSESENEEFSAMTGIWRDEENVEHYYNDSAWQVWTLNKFFLCEGNRRQLWIQQKRAFFYSF